jgi:UDP-N-acetylmuramoyl-L-alanyl-D-glutamate--2,6-diaminopimelate ligase
MNILELVKGLDGVNIIGKNINVENLSYSTSTVSKNCLFFCIEGLKNDGHNFAQKAVDNGAKVLVISKEVEVKGDVTKIKVQDTREAMSIISSNFYGNPSEKLDVIGITGTNGKTTSTFMIKSIIDLYGKRTGLLGTIYNIIGEKVEEAKRTTPESMDLQGIFSEMQQNGVQSCIMEVSSHSLDLKRVEGVKFKAGIFTNLTQDHLDFHGNMEDYFNAKMKLFDNCEVAVINLDDEYGSKALKMIKNSKIITYGIERESDVYAKDIVITGEGTGFTLCYKDIFVPIRLHLPGKFNVYNALGCAAASIGMGIEIDIIKKGLESLENVPGRSEKINSKKGFTIVIDYAHTPDGIINILNTAREYTSSRLVALFGCGGDRDKTKRPIMGRAAGSIADFCIVTSDNPRTEDPTEIIKDIIPGVVETKCPYIIIEDRRRAIQYAIENGKKGDVIVIAGKGHETYQILKDTTIPFDEREIVKDILKEEV